MVLTINSSGLMRVHNDLSKLAKQIAKKNNQSIVEATKQIAKTMKVKEFRVSRKNRILEELKL